MDLLSTWWHQLFSNTVKEEDEDEEEEEEEDVKLLKKKVKHLYKPCVLTQGQQLRHKQAETVETLTPNLLAFNESITTPYVNTSPFVNTQTYAQYSPANTYANGVTYSTGNTSGNTRKEGFTTIDTNRLSSEYGAKIDRYATEYPSLVTHGRLYAQGTDRTKNIKANTLDLQTDINRKYALTAEPDGCYKQVTGATLVDQTDLPTVTLETCTKRTAELGYAGFSLKQKGDGQLGCYVTNDLAGNKTAGLATKSQTSLAFKTGKSANRGGLLATGQLGLFQDATPLATDLPAVPGCDAKGGKILINPASITATYGGNCQK